jgi:hypothetical protein
MAQDSRFLKKLYEKMSFVRAIYDYNSTTETCLSFKRGDIIYLHGTDPTGM